MCEQDKIDNDLEQLEKNNVKKSNPEDAAAVQIGIKPEEFKRKIDYRLNQIKVEKAFHDILERDGMIPDIVIVAKETKLHYNTVRDHMENMTFEKCKKEFKYLSKSIVKNIGEIAGSKDKQAVPAAKLYEQMIDNFSETNTLIHLEVNKITEMIDAIIVNVDGTITDKDQKAKLIQEIIKTLENLSLNTTIDKTKTN